MRLYARKRETSAKNTNGSTSKPRSIQSNSIRKSIWCGWCGERTGPTEQHRTKSRTAPCNTQSVDRAFVRAVGAFVIQYPDRAATATATPAGSANYSKRRIFSSPSPEMGATHAHAGARTHHGHKRIESDNRKMRYQNHIFKPNSNPFIDTHTTYKMLYGHAGHC